MAKEKLVTIHVHTPFTLTLGDQSKQEFGRGRHNVPEEVASHWFTQAHSELSESVISDTDDLQPIIDSLQAQIADKDKQIVDKDQLIGQSIVEAFQCELTRRIGALFPSSRVTVKIGSVTGVELQGLEREADREALDSILREVWEDESWR